MSSHWQVITDSNAKNFDAANALNSGQWLWLFVFGTMATSGVKRDSERFGF